MLRGKLVMVGDGFVGSACAYTIMLAGHFSEIVLIDINRDRASGDALDMAHAAAFESPVSVYAGDWHDCKNADIAVIAAGANQKPGETRIDLLNRNSVIFKDVVSSILKYAPSDIILLVISNPVDILTYITYKLSGLPKRQIIGSGTVLDTARMKYLISRHSGVDARYCHTYVMGEHGDSEVAAWSITNIAGMPIKEFFAQSGECTDADLAHMQSEVKNSAYEIIRKKGATYYGIAAAAAKITECIAHSDNSIMTVSSILDGEYGISGIALSAPTQLAANGVERILEVPIDAQELANLHKSAETLKASARRIEMFKTMQE